MSPAIRRGRTLQRRLDRSGNKYDFQENHPLISAEDGDFDNMHNDKSPIIDQESTPTTPERPSMGSRSAMNRARADRENRYLALLDQDPETASDTETDPDLNLVPSPARTSRYSSHKPTAVSPDDSSLGLDRTTNEFRFAVEAIERTSGIVYDRSDDDFHFAVEAIERTSGTVYDQSSPSSTESFSQVSALFRSDLPYMVEAIERMPRSSSAVLENPSLDSLELRDIERRRPSSQGLPKGPSFGNTNVVQIPRETLDDTDGTSLARIVQAIRDSKRSSESTVAVESDPFLAMGQDRMQNKVDRITTPTSEVNATTADQAKSLGLPRTSSSSYSSCTDESCALTTHDPLCYAPPPWPTVHCRTSPSPDRASFDQTTQSPSNDDGNGDEKGTHLESQIDEYKRSPWSNLFDNNMDIKNSAEPLPPKETGLSEITLPASTFLKLDSRELPLRLKKDHDSEIRHTASRRGHNGSDLDEAARREFEYSPDSMERSFNAARLPAFGETLPQLTYSPPRGRKVPNKAKRPVRYKSTLAEISGNAGKAYTYSQIVKGDQKVDQLKHGLEMIGSLEDDAPNGKGVSWAKEDELIGYADPQTPISKRISLDSPDRALAERHDVEQTVDTSDKENAAFEWKPSLEQDFRVSHYMVMNASIDTPDLSFSNPLEKQSPLCKLDRSKPPVMTPSARKIFKNLFKVDGDTAIEGATYDVKVVSPWNESEKKSVAKHLMSVVYDLEEQSVKAGLEEDEEKEDDDGDESEEKSEVD